MARFEFPIALRPITDFEMSLHLHLNAGFRLMIIPTAEEARAEQSIARVALGTRRPIYTWDVADGWLRSNLEDSAEQLFPEFKATPQANQLQIKGTIHNWLTQFPDPQSKQESIKPPRQVVREIAAHSLDLLPAHAIVILRDFEEVITQDIASRRALKALSEYAVPFPDDAALQRRIRLQWLDSEGNPDRSPESFEPRIYRPTILLTNSDNLPPKLRPYVTNIDFPLPSETERSHVLVQFPSQGAPTPTEVNQRILNAGAGMTARQFEDAVSLSWGRQQGRLTAASPYEVQIEKASIVGSGGVLSYTAPDQLPSEADIGGFTAVLSYLDTRRTVYDPDAREHKLDLPKGIALAGLPGTGKSFITGCIARKLDLPRYTLDIGALFGGHVGETEKNWRDTRRVIDAQQGCVLVLDEVDKGFGGAHQASGDSGVTRRLFGQVLTWLSEKRDRTFVVATLNRVEGLPPEFLRPGRFDAVFFVDLPDTEERLQIMFIHLQKRGVNPTDIMSAADWGIFVDGYTKDFVGSEIESMIVEARCRAWASRRTGVPSVEELAACSKELIPLAHRDAEAVEEMRKLITEKRARPASGKPLTGAEAPRANSRQAKRALSAS